METLSTREATVTTLGRNTIQGFRQTLQLERRRQQGVPATIRPGKEEQQETSLQLAASEEERIGE